MKPSKGHPCAIQHDAKTHVGQGTGRDREGGLLGDCPSCTLRNEAKLLKKPKSNSKCYENLEISILFLLQLGWG